MEIQPNHDLAEELIRMADIDQDMRTRFQEGANEWDESIDESNTARLKEIVADIGWPTVSKVGTEASQAAWMLVQHAHEDSEFMKKCLELMKEAESGDVAPENIAFLEDRLLTIEGEPQIYGTQFYKEGDVWKLFPISNAENIDDRRHDVGLGTLAENETFINAKQK